MILEEQHQLEDHPYLGTHIFLVVCYSCNSFGHKAINFRAYAKGGKA
jgi:hypothetical protein